MAKSLERYDTMAPIFWGLTNNILSRGRVAESLPWVEEMLEIAERSGDADLLITGHGSACNCHAWAGNLIEAVEHADKVLKLYDNETPLA